MNNIRILSLVFLLLTSFPAASETALEAENQFDIMNLLEGRWKSFVVDESGTKAQDHVIINYVRSGSDDALYGDIGAVSIVYNRPMRSNLIYRTEIICRPGGGVSYNTLVGKLDHKANRVEWFIGSISGPRKIIWTLQGDKKIVIEMDPEWVAKRVEELAQSKIPRDVPSEGRFTQVMEKINKE